MVVLGQGEVAALICAVFYLIYKLHSLIFASVVLCVFAAVALSYLAHGKNYWKRQGIPGPTPYIFTGNAREYEKGLHTLEERWIPEYGKTYGMFLMSSPELVSTDLDILRQVLVKDFDHFTDRTNLLNVDPSDQKSLLATSLVSLKGLHWSNVRSQVAPAFSTGKIKLMIPIFNECSRICTKILDEYEVNGKPVPIRDVIIRLTLDMTSKCAFGYDFNVQHNPTSPFIQFAKKFSEFDLRAPEVTFVILFPNIAAAFQKITGVSVLNNAANKFFLNTLENLLEDRRKGSDLKYNDFFQILLDSLVEDDEGRVKDQEIEFELQNTSKGLTKGDILGQAFMFVLAGFETTPAALHLAIYMLAVHRDIQHRCREEILRVCKHEADITYEMLNELKYTEQCIAETLRMYPPVVRTNRLCTSDVKINGIEMRKGCIFTLPIRAIHYSEEFYPSPEVFDPERWTTEARSLRDPLTYVPFGYGPRNCIGMRVAQMQMKVALAHILRRYELRPGEVLDLPLRINTVGSMRTVDDLSVILTRI
ncbi:unspecific monooxygenase [Ancylostoma caninum]|uniref:Unspecific monooxygenase n=1 Tax=Ancylostoma caninum TaxID=29170 RepID=A0A368GIP0_ANCCA|nr:unspecific monooxygenase [Ancylostoma caninum]